MKNKEALEKLYKVKIYQKEASAYDYLKDIYKEEIETIKQDLEIFNIIKQLFIHNKKYLGVQKSLNSFKALVNCGEITQEQYDELKVWLENEK